MTPEEALAIAQAEAEVKAKEPSVAGDVGKSFGSRFLGGVTDILSGMGGTTPVMPGEMTQDTMVPGDPMQNQLTMQGGQAGRELVESVAPGATTYDPQTQAGRFAGTIGDAASGLAFGPGGALRKGVMSIAAGGTSEAAGQLAAEYAPAYEPAARIGGMMAGGVAGAGKPAPNTVLSAAKKVAKGAPSPELLRTVRDQMYQAFRDAGIKYDADTFAGLGQQIYQALFRAGHRPSNAPEAFRYADDLTRQATQGPSPDFDDIERLSQTIGSFARDAFRQNKGSLGDALHIVRSLVDDFGVNSPLISSIPASAKMIEKWRGVARGVALRAIKSRRLEEMLEDAENYTGGFIEGITSQINRLLKNKYDKQLFNQNEKELLKAVRDGNTPVNKLSKLGVSTQHILPAAGMMSLPTSVAIHMGSPAAIPILAAGGAMTIGSALKAAKPGIARGRMNTALSAVRSGDLKNSHAAVKLEQNRRRMRQLMSGVPAGQELERQIQDGTAE